MFKIQKDQSGIIHIKLLLVAVLIIGAVGFTGWKVYDINNKSSNTRQATETENTDDEDKNDKNEIVIVEASELEKTSDSTASPDGTVKKPTSSPAPKEDVPATKPSTSCSGKGSKYTSAWLGDNSYSSAKKFKDAVAFAGLTSVVDTNDVVVFAVNDYVFENSLTASQKAFMNASPANMKSVIGWHIVKSCTTWAGGIKGAASKVTINTLNGPVTYSPGSPGYVNDARMAIWDWFTRNGAVHFITDFIAPPAQ